MKKIVVNEAHCGFYLSKKAKEMLPLTESEYIKYSNRDNADLVSVVETLGDAANGATFVGGHSSFAVKEIPDEATDWKIIEYDGMEFLIYVLDGKIVEAI